MAVLLFCIAPTGLAQISLGTQGARHASTLVEEADVLRNALDGFRTTAEHTLADADLDAAQTQAASAYLESAAAQFARDARLLTGELKGDGLLEAQEVSEEFAELRDRYIKHLEEAIAALADGYPPPPSRENFNSAWEYRSTLALYTLRTRNDPGDWLWLIGGLIAGLMLSWWASKLLRAAGQRLESDDHRWLSQLGEALAGPLTLAVIALALRLGFEWLWIPGIAGDFLDKLVGTLLIAALFWFLWKACRGVARGIAWLLRNTYDTRIDKHVVLVLSRALRVIVLIAFTLTVVKGVMDSNLTGVVAGLGIIGVALSFILRGTIENIAASFTIFGDQPFRVGDLVIYDDHWGNIEDIGFRSTRFRTLSGHLITIPNAKLVEDAIHNVGVRPSIRRRFRIGLPYDTPPEKIEQAISILHELLDDHRGQPADRPARVALEQFSEYEVRLLVQYYFEPADYWQALEFDTELNLAILRRFSEHGIEFAFPTQTLYLNQDEGETGPQADEARETVAEGSDAADPRELAESASEETRTARTDKRRQAGSGSR